MEYAGSLSQWASEIDYNGSYDASGRKVDAALLTEIADKVVRSGEGLVEGDRDQETLW